MAKHIHIHLNSVATRDAGGRRWDAVGGIGMQGDYAAWGQAAKEHGLTEAEFKELLNSAGHLSTVQGQWALSGFRRG